MWLTRFGLSEHTNLRSFLIGRRTLFWVPAPHQISSLSETVNIFHLKGVKGCHD